MGYYAPRARVLDTIGLVWPDAVGSESWVELARVHDPDYPLLVAKRGNVDLMRRDLDLRTRYNRSRASAHPAIATWIRRRSSSPRHGRMICCIKMGQRSEQWLSPLEADSVALLP